jgi:hypothetical protein
LAIGLIVAGVVSGLLFVIAAGPQTDGGEAEADSGGDAA